MATAWNWIIANGVALGVAIGLATLFVAVVAAWAGVHYGRRSVSQGREALDEARAGVGQAREAIAQAREAQRIADERYERDVQPRPRIARFSPSPFDVQMPGELSVDVVNAGGAAIHVLLLIELTGRLYAGQTPLPMSGVTGVRLPFKAVVSAGGSPEPKPVMMAAQDARGLWWDCVAGQIIGAEVVWWWEKRAKELSVAMVALYEIDNGRYRFG